MSSEPIDLDDLDGILTRVCDAIYQEPGSDAPGTVDYVLVTRRHACDETEEINLVMSDSLPTSTLLGMLQLAAHCHINSPEDPDA
ncbi:hypothetical protein [Corynebacterium sp. TAE3-ERU16]|uniref:hypothetical protein n=1 Tax=Corynebacterium sp. TAE3-ERU16 TaxID=2849493 RepID=UPI001C46DFF6|nr:hypothetical protein [Corynebacterium sp. TAE3-ERU16]MBV7292357.1 hypothetical protein [Corynebacterium sp. TAE3-ERU16]